MAGRGGRGEGANSSSFLGSLKDALAAASRTDTRSPSEAGDETARIALSSEVDTSDGLKDVTEAAKALDAAAEAGREPPAIEERASEIQPGSADPPPIPTRAVDAAREARGGRPNVPPIQPTQIRDNEPPTTRVHRDTDVADAVEEGPVQTQLIRGKQKVERGSFKEDPVVGWLVVIGGPGLGSFRPVFEGNNTIGRGQSNRVPIDFGDTSISEDEQAYIRYDSSDRAFLLVPNLSKTNVVSVNETKPTQAVQLAAMDLITMGRTQLVFVPFCGPEFDWGDLSELNSR